MYFGHCVRCAIPRSGQPRPTGSTFVRNAKRRGRTVVRPQDSTPGGLSGVEFLGEMRGLLHSRALLPLIPPTPFSHKGRRGSLGFRKPRMRKGMQGLPKKPTPVSTGRGDSQTAPPDSSRGLAPPQGSHTRDGWSAYYIVTPDVCDTTCNEKFAPNNPLFRRPVFRLPVSALPLR